jgi:DNA-binding YbaB/EbfC family protein
MPGGLGDMMGMIQKAQQQAEQMKVKMEADLKEKIVEGSTGGGMVTVTCTGGMEVRSIKIDGSVIDPDDTEMLEDLLTAAVNVALKKAKSLQDEAQSSQLGNMLGGMPGMGGAGAGGMPDLGSHLGGRGGLGG